VDLQNGVSDSISVPVAYIAGAVAADGSNLSGLGSTGGGEFIAGGCGTLGRAPLALKLNKADWPSVFASDGMVPANDGVVPELSQLNEPAPTPTTVTVTGVIHSPGIEVLGFSGPTSWIPKAEFRIGLLTY
jgi:hypothetical protein